MMIFQEKRSVLNAHEFRTGFDAEKTNLNHYVSRFSANLQTFVAGIKGGFYVRIGRYRF
ncbi:MAG: hypothetical protein LBF72_02580 [Holosporales bacterium]|nr:hypothetical protein [Holosporales bacterium]